MLPFLEPPGRVQPDRLQRRRDSSRAQAPAYFGAPWLNRDKHTLLALKPVPPVLPALPLRRPVPRYMFGSVYFQSIKPWTHISWFPKLPVEPLTRRVVRQQFPLAPHIRPVADLMGGRQSVPWLSGTASMHPQFTVPRMRTSRDHLRAPAFMSSKVPKLGVKTITPED